MLGRERLDARRAGQLPVREAGPRSAQTPVASRERLHVAQVPLHLGAQIGAFMNGNAVQLSAVQLKPALDEPLGDIGRTILL